MIEQDQDPERNKNGLSLRERYDVEDPDIIITGSTNTRVNQQQVNENKISCWHS